MREKQDTARSLTYGRSLRVSDFEAFVRKGVPAICVITGPRVSLSTDMVL
jgi:hypothetical protein